VKRTTATIVRRLGWHPWSVEVRLLAHALCHGLWRPLLGRRFVGEQRVLTWVTRIPDLGTSPAIVAHLRQSGLRVQEGGNAFYLPPQPGLASMLGGIVDRYPRGSGFKILRDFRDLREAHYLHPERQSRLRRRLIGTPHHQLMTANYLHRLGLGPRVWDVCLLRAGGLPMPTFVVQHVEGRAPDADECAAFLRRLRAALSATELRISVPNWERNKDFRCPSCNHNLLRDAGGGLSYIDFQNFTVRNPARILPTTIRDRKRPWRLRPWSEAPATGHDAARRAGMIRSLLREHGLELANRLVLDIGCREGAMLHQALGAGAWWALGWDQPRPALRAQDIAMTLGFTRLEITPADLNEEYDVKASVPDWLCRYLDESVVLVRAARPPREIPHSLVDLPWRALVYEGLHGESLADARDDLQAFLTRSARLAAAGPRRDPGAGAAPLLLIVREPGVVGLKRSAVRV
jgi:hypothetical protein